MKKISMLIALVCCVTIGGVYATWSYASGAVQSAVDDKAKLEITAASEVTKGILEITSNTLKVTIDDDGSHNGVISVAGELTFTYTPADGQTGIALQFVLGGTIPDVVITTDPQDISAGAAIKSGKVTAIEVQALLQSNIVLPTIKDHTDYTNSLTSASLTVTIQEKANV